MPFTQQDLFHSINHSDTHSIKRILADRDHNKVLRTNINTYEIGSQKYLWLSFALFRTCYPKNSLEEALFVTQALLSVCDAQGNPVIDLDQQDARGQTAFFTLLVLSEHLHFKITQQLLKKFYKTTKLNKKPRLNLHHEIQPGGRVLFEKVCQLGDEKLLRLLIDATHEEGSNCFPINYIFNQVTSEQAQEKQTLLDLASAHPEMALIIRERGGLHYHELSPIRPIRPRKICPQSSSTASDGALQQISQSFQALSEHFESLRAISPISVTALGDELERFNQYEHSAHAATINSSVKESVRKLQERYGLRLQIHQNLEEIFDFLTNLPSRHPQKREALNLFDELREDPWQQPETRLTFPHALALIWEGIKDATVDTAPPEMLENNLMLTEDYIATRKIAFVEQLFEANTSYRHDLRTEQERSCPQGVFNRIISTLNHAHADVSIRETKARIKQDALSNTTNFLARQLKRKDKSEQRKILKEWDNSLNPVTKKFRDELVRSYDQELRQTYEHLLEEPERKMITDHFSSLSKPEIYPLVTLEKKIRAISPPQHEYMDPTMATLQTAASEIYNTQSSYSFDEAHSLLTTQAKKVIDKRCKTSDQLFKHIASIRSESPFNTQVLTHLENKAKEVANGTDWSAVEKYGLLNQDYQAFNELHFLIKSIDEINEIQNNTQYNQAAKELKERAFRCDGNINEGRSFSQELQLLKRKYEFFCTQHADPMFKSLAEKIAAHPDNRSNSHRLERTEFLKAKAIYLTEHPRSCKEKHQAMRSLYDEFKALDWQSLEHDNTALIEPCRILVLKFHWYLIELEHFTSQISNPNHLTILENFRKHMKHALDQFKLALTSSDNNLNEQINELNDTVKNNIQQIKIALAQEAGLWSRLHPILKGFLGILAALSIIPALIIQFRTPHGFMGTFFCSPLTGSSQSFRAYSLDTHPNEPSIPSAPL